MDDWEDAYQKLAAMNCGQEPQNTIEAGGPGGKKMSLAQQIAGPPPLAKQISAARTSIKKQAGDSLSARASGALSDDGEGFDPYPAAVTQGWFKGPTNPQGVCCEDACVCVCVAKGQMQESNKLISVISHGQAFLVSPVVS